MTKPKPQNQSHILISTPSPFPLKANFIKRSTKSLMVVEKMQKALRAYGEVLRLIRLLPKDSRPYYAKFARENFVNYREVNSSDSTTMDELLNRTYTHSIWVLHKYSVDEAVADKLKRVCCS